MKFLRSLKAFAALAAIAVAFSSAAARADLSYLVSINTSPLTSNASAPFYVDFQSIFGSGSAQTFSVSALSYNGGSATDGGTIVGAVSGNPASLLTINTDSVNSYNEYFQQFSSTVSSISFNLNLTTNSSGAQPTSFSIAILSSESPSLPFIPTNGYLDTLANFSVDGANTGLITGSSTGATGGVTISVTAIPEPSTYAMIAGTAALGLAALRRRSPRLAA